MANSSSTTSSTATADYTAPTAQWSAVAVSNAWAEAKQAGSQVKTKGGVVVLLLLGAVLAFGQTDNMLYVKQFPGLTVGQKLTNAMQACNPNTAVPCILVIDPSLATWAAGTMPSLCSQCSLIDYRVGGAVATVANVAGFVGATADAKLNACVASLPQGGTCDARGFGASTQTIAATVNLGGSRYPFTFVFDPATSFVPGSASMTMFALQPGASVRGTLTATLGSTFTGNALALQGNTYSNQADGQSNDAIPTAIDGLICAGQGNTLGTCLYLEGENATTEWVEFQHFGKINVSGMKYGIHGYSASNGWINGNDFDSILCSNSVYCLVLETGASGNMVGNTFKLVQPEGWNGYAQAFVDGVWLKGTGAITGNFIFEVAWDWVSHTSCASCNTYQIDSNTLSNSAANVLTGIIDVQQITDPNGVTLITDLSGVSASQMAGPWAYSGSLAAANFNATGANQYKANGTAILANDGTNTYVVATGAGVYLQTAGGNAVLDSGGGFTIPTAGNLTVPKIKATTGTRYVCVDTTGKLVSQSTACSGT